MLSFSELLVIGVVIVVVFSAAAVLRMVLMHGRGDVRTSPPRPESSRVDVTPSVGAEPATVAVHDERLERLEDVFDHIDHAVVVVDESGRRTFMNAAASRLRDSRDGGLLVQDVIEELLDRALAGEDVTQEVDLFGPPARSFMVSARPLRSAHGSGAVVTAEDVTLRRRTDSVRRDFVANISHELKSPVAAMGLLAEMINGETDTETVERLAARIAHEAERMGDTIDDLLVLANIEFAEDARFEEVGISKIISETLERVSTTADRAGIRIETPIDPPGTIVCDRRQMVSALHNLIDNAIKYSPESGRVRVDVVRDDPAGTVEFVVTDDGPGIPRRDLDRVFERFYRVDRGRSRATGGTGLGLAIVRHVADNHGGSVEVESHEGVGSTFTLRVEVAPPAPPG